VSEFFRRINYYYVGNYYLREDEPRRLRRPDDSGKLTKFFGMVLAKRLYTDVKAAEVRALDVNVIVLNTVSGQNS
jgi:hypothetical protein